MFALQMKYKSFLNLYSFCKKFFFFIIKNIFVIKHRCELNKLVLKVSEVLSLWYSLNQLFPNHKQTS